MVASYHGDEDAVRLPQLVEFIDGVSEALVVWVAFLEVSQKLDVLRAE